MIINVDGPAALVPAKLLDELALHSIPTKPCCELMPKRVGAEGVPDFLTIWIMQTELRGPLHYGVIDTILA